LGPIPNPQSPIPNPQSPFFFSLSKKLIIYLKIKYFKNIKNNLIENTNKIKILSLNLKIILILNKVNILILNSLSPKKQLNLKFVFRSNIKICLQEKEIFLYSKEFF